MIKTDLKTDDIILETNDLWKSYYSGKHEVRVLTGITMQVKTGEFLTISGASGAGKSTLLHILGLLDEPTKGKVFFKGVDSDSLTGKKKAELRNKSIGFVFQFFHLLPEFNAFENVLLPALIHKNGFSRKEMKERAQNLLDQVGLGHRLTHKPSELSGGEQQRVAIARALMNNPDIILADEPTGNLDRSSSDEIVTILRDLNTRFSQTIVIVTHNMEFAQLGDRQLRMVDGLFAQQE